jgi:hypothetical protein
VHRAAALLLVLGALVVAGCGGPLSPTGDPGTAVDPVGVLTILPSPGDLRGPHATKTDATELQMAFTGSPNPALVDRIAANAPTAAGVRTWTGPGGQTLTATVSVWSSHLTATGVVTDLAQELTDRGADAWTPSQIGGTRGARLDDDSPGQRGRELRLGYSVGLNALYVRATGPVPDETVTRALQRLIEVVDAQQ